MNAEDVVRWAAGAVHKPLEGAALDAEELFHLLACHRLTSRFFHRVSQERPAWCSRKMRIGAWKAHSQARENLRRQVQAVRDLNGSFDPGGQPLVIFKGLSTYALTGDERHVRWSSDVDLSTSDPEALWDTLVRLGYLGERILWGHEHSTMSLRGVSLEIHRYFPVPILPAGVLTADLSPLNHPGVWMQRFGNVETGEIRHEDFVENSMLSTVPEVEGLAVPHPSMAILILCAHLLRDYMEPTFASRDLLQLADVHDLLGHPQFDEHLLLSLADRLGGQDAIKFTGQLLRAHFGADWLPQSFSRSDAADNERVRSASFPQRLTWHGGWAERIAPQDTDALLTPLDMSALINGLGTNAVVVSEDGAKNFYAHPTREGAGIIERVIVQVIRGEPFAFDFCVTWSEQVLGFEVHVPQPLDTAYTIEVATEQHGLHHVDLHLDGVQLSEKGIGSASLHAGEEGFTLRVELSQRSWQQGHCSESAPLPVLLSVARWGQHLPDVVTLIPLQLIRN